MRKITVSTTVQGYKKFAAVVKQIACGSNSICNRTFCMVPKQAL